MVESRSTSLVAPLRCYDQLPAAAALQANRDTDGQGLDLGARVRSHLLSGLDDGAVEGLNSGSLLPRQLCR
jgi:hypothetical protein